MSETTRLNLPLLAQSQAQKHITHNEALFTLDMLAQASVKRSDLATPPNDAVKGDCFLIASGAASEWVGRDNHLAYWTGQAWLFAMPGHGWRVWNMATGQLLLFDGSAWKIDGHIPLNIRARSHLGILTDADDINRLSVKSDAILFSHDDATPGSGNVQAKLNKKVEAASATFLFQNNWQGHAEIGLAGDNHFSFKTSPDGSTWQTALRLDKNSGVTELPLGGKAGAPFQVANYRIANLPDATLWPSGLVIVTNAPSGHQPAFSDGTHWRWVHNNTLVS